MKLETIGKILASGFGDRVATGILFSFIENVTPARLYEYIKEDKPLGYWLSDGDWERYRGMVKNVDASTLGEVTWQRAVSELRKRRPELLGVIINTPGGHAWLEKQLNRFKERLGLG